MLSLKHRGGGITFHIARVTMTDDLHIYELDPYALKIYQMSENELRTSRLLKVIILQADRETTEIITINYYGW